MPVFRVDSGTLLRKSADRRKREKQAVDTWDYHNPVRISFGPGQFERLAHCIGGRRYCLVTYPEPHFAELAKRLAADAGDPLLVVDDIAPNPDVGALERQSRRFAEPVGDVEVIVALGGGSVIDSAKVFAAAGGDFSRVIGYLRTGEGAEQLGSIPLIAVPTTAGTGSEVTRWATVWDVVSGKKHSLARPELYPEHAVVDPQLMLGKPGPLTVATGLDALSHALESIWNVNANPISAFYAVTAAKEILATLPALSADLHNLELRSRMAKGALLAGLAFSNTKTAIAHNLSYPITLGWGVQHGIACSFTLPTILRSVSGIGGFREAALNDVFGADLEAGADGLTAFLDGLGVGSRFRDHGVPEERNASIIEEAFAGERGRNFIGTKDRFIEAAGRQGAL